MSRAKSGSDMPKLCLEIGCVLVVGWCVAMLFKSADAKGTLTQVSSLIKQGSYSYPCDGSSATMNWVICKNTNSNSGGQKTDQQADKKSNQQTRIPSQVSSRAPVTVVVGNKKTSESRQLPEEDEIPTLESSEEWKLRPEEYEWR